MLRQNPALVIFTRLPEGEGVKTRLIPFLSQGDAAALQRCMLQDTVALASRIGEYTLVVCHAPVRDRGLLRYVGKKTPLIMQRGGSLGERMANAFQEVFSWGYSPAVLIGTDIPTLPGYLLEDALGVLEKRDVVLGPSLDGGYYLIGKHRLNREIFAEIDWGTPRVLAQTVSRIKKERMSFSCLEAWYDVDVPQDLAFLWRHIEALRESGTFWPRNTYRFLRRRGL